MPFQSYGHLISQCLSAWSSQKLVNLSMANSVLRILRNKILTGALDTKTSWKGNMQLNQLFYTTGSPAFNGDLSLQVNYRFSLRLFIFIKFDFVGCSSLDFPLGSPTIKLHRCLLRSMCTRTRPSASRREEAMTRGTTQAGA